VAPNWRTSYRLKCSALVAVVRLGAAGEALGAGHPLIWAEVVPVIVADGVDQDFQQRAQGRLAVRPLARSDLGALFDPAVGGSLESGERVAVIDLRVFVPEVVSVLGTLFQPGLAAQLQGIPFSGHLIGASAPQRALALPMGMTAAAVIEDAVRTSEMDALRRLTTEGRAALVQKLAALGARANLYGTQLLAFAESLRCSLHCTQGPPGTGKVQP
jgi:hypothetical protein